MFKKIETFFMNQAKNIVFVCTVIALFTLTGIGFYMVILYSSSPGDVTVSESGKISSYREVLAKQHEAKYKKEKEQTKVEEIKPSDKKYHPEVMSRIITNINSYTIIVGEDPVDEERFINYVKGVIENDLEVTDEFEVSQILSELETETMYLSALGEEMKTLPITDTRRIESRSYIAWFFDEKLNAYIAADDKIKREESRVRNNKKVADELFGIIWIFAVVFGALLAFLIYMRIDLGIRLISKVIIERENK